MTDADPYLPGHGDVTYAVEHYDLTLTYKPASNLLTGEAALLVRILEPTRRIRLDLHHLAVRGVKVSGAALAKYTHRAGHLTLALREPVAAGTSLRVSVRYGGNPRPVRIRHLGEAGWEELTDGVIIAAQPHGASSWFPCNDRAANKATYALTFTAPAEYTAGFSGRLREVRRRGATRTWSFVQEHPMAPYLATVQLGRYSETVLAGGPVGKGPIVVLAPPGLDGAGFAATFARQDEMMACFEQRFGPYPFAGYRAVITDDDLEIPLESQALSTFGRNHCEATWEAERLVAHEMAHQWFGNAVTASQWRDIWLHEGFACYAEWLWSEASGRRSADSWAREQHARLAGLRQDVLLGDPGPALMFDDRVYKRGALTLHAVRHLVGDAAFFAMLGSWVDENRGGAVTTLDFAAHVERVTGVLVAELIDDWVYRKALPPLPNGALRR